jgi:hypothetical protein
MKKIIFLLSVLGIVFLGSYEGKGQTPACPDGYISQIIQINVGGCTYKVTICHTPCPLSAIQVRITDVQKIDPNCDPGMDFSAVMNFIYNRFKDGNFLTQYVCGMPGPCEGPGAHPFDLILAYEICWYKQVQNDGSILYIPCNLDNCFCLDHWLICWNGTAYVTTHVDYDTPPSPSISCHGWDIPKRCSPTEEQVPNPPVGIYSPCFHIETPCNPQIQW